jgi:hypothetical protein
MVYQTKCNTVGYNQKCQQVPVNKCQAITKCHRIPKTTCKPFKTEKCGNKQIKVPVKKMQHKCLAYEDRQRDNLASCTKPQDGYGPPPSSSGSGYVAPSSGYGAPSSSYGAPSSGYGAPSGDILPPNTPGTGYGSPISDDMVPPPPLPPAFPSQQNSQGSYNAGLVSPNQDSYGSPTDSPLTFDSLPNQGSYNGPVSPNQDSYGSPTGSPLTFDSLPNQGSYNGPVSPNQDTYGSPTGSVWQQNQDSIISAPNSYGGPLPAVSAPFSYGAPTQDVDNNPLLSSYQGQLTPRQPNSGATFPPSHRFQVQ